MGGDTLSGFFGSGGITGWDIVGALVVIVIAWVASIFVKRGMVALLSRTPGVSPTVTEVIARVSKYLVILVGIGIGLAFLGASVQPVLAIAIIVAVVLVLALRGIADNFAAGVVLQSRHPIKVGDEIAVDDYIGVILELNGRTVIMRTYDGRTVHVPNGLLLRDPLVNHSQAGARRSEVEVRIANDELTFDLEAITTVLLDATAGVSGVHKHDAPRVLFTAVGPQRVTTKVQFWHHPQHGITVSSAVVRALSESCADHAMKATVSSQLPDPPLTAAEEV